MNPSARKVDKVTDYCNVDEEVAAAEAALKAAQDRLEAARAKQAQARAGIGVDDSQLAGQSQPFAQAAPGVGAASQQPYTQSAPQQQPPYSQAASQQSAPFAYASPQQPAGYAQSAPQQPYSQAAPQTKDHVAAGLLAIFLGCLGIHKFYLGYNTPGFIMLAITVIGSIFSLGIAGVVMLVISIVEGVIYLSKSQTEFEQIYVFGDREWF